MRRILIISSLFVFSTCVPGKNGVKPTSSGDSSAGSSMIMSLPDDGSVSPELLKKLTGYTLEITPVSDSCKNPTKFKKTVSWTDMKINQKIAPGCDYNVALEVGNFSNDSLDTVYLSNLLSNQKGTALLAIEFSGKPTFKKSIALESTSDGLLAGFGQMNNSGSTPAPDTTPQPKNPDTAPAPKPAQTFKITVKDGYSPDSITVKKGVPLQISFYRDEKSGCSKQVVFKDFNVTRDLAAFQTTVVEFTPDKVGEFRFTCAMNMLDGKIIVTD